MFECWRLQKTEDFGDGFIRFQVLTIISENGDGCGQGNTNLPVVSPGARDPALDKND